MSRFSRRAQAAASGNTAIPTGPNLLIGKVFTSTVGDSTSEPGNPIAHATDQNVNTRWISQPTSPVSITADLGGTYDLTRVVIMFAANTIQDYTLSVSTNGSTYTEIASGTTNNTTFQTVAITSFSATPKGRYLRITGIDRWNQSFGNSIWEVEAYGTLDSSSPTGTISSFSAAVASDTQINLTWSYSGSALTNYTLRRNGTVISNPAAGATSFNNTGLTAGTTYNYTLTGNYSAGGTTNTATDSATTTGGSGGGAGNLGMMIFVQQATWAQDLAALVATGSTWVRMDIPIGAYGNMSGGTFTPYSNMVTFYRQAAQEAKDAGLKIVLVMAAAYNDNAWSEAQFRSYNGQYWAAVSDNIGDLVDLWQVFNEHDGRDYRNHAPISLSTAYLTRFRDTLASCRTSLGLHSSAPLTTTPFGYPVDQARYDKWVTFFDGIGSSLDVICVHAYPETSQTVIDRVPTYMNNLRNRYSKPVGILEFGLPSVSGYGTFTQVGDAIVKQIAAIMSMDPFCATLYQLRDRGTDFNNGEMVFGILNNNFTQKSYYNAVVTEVQKWD